MVKMSIPVTVESVKASKEGSNCAGYVDLEFTGGSANLSVNAEQFKQFESLVDDEVECVFQMKAKNIVNNFKRSECVFTIRRLLQIKGQGGK